jgi:hypothetical protein
MLLRILEECKKKRLRKKGEIIVNKQFYRAAQISSEVINSHKKNVDIDWRW